MALTYLNLVNKVLTRLNEVNLSSSTFAGATGFHALVKEATNSAIFSLNNQKFEWPFNFTSGSITCVPGQREYTIPTDMKAVDWESFWVERDETLPFPVSARKLEHIDYNHYRETRLINDQNSGDAGNNVPDWVARTQNRTFVLSPIPNQEYVINYEYWSLPVALVDYDDETTVPETYEEVLLNGIMFYSELFRQNFEVSQIYNAMFEKGIADMTRILIPIAPYVRDTRGDGAIRSATGFA